MKKAALYIEQPLFDLTPYEVEDAKFRSLSPENVEKLSKQNKQLYEWLKVEGHAITSLRAMKKFGIIRLASRINELKKIIAVYDRWIELDDGTRVKEYAFYPFKIEK